MPEAGGSNVRRLARRRLVIPWVRGRGVDLEEASISIGEDRQFYFQYREDKAYQPVAEVLWSYSFKTRLKFPSTPNSIPF